MVSADELCACVHVQLGVNMYACVVVFAAVRVWHFL